MCFWKTLVLKFLKYKMYDKQHTLSINNILSACRKTKHEYLFALTCFIIYKYTGIITESCYDFFSHSTLKNHKGGISNAKLPYIQHIFKIVLYRCLDLIRHNIGTHLKHNKYIFNIPIPFCPAKLSPFDFYTPLFLSNELCQCG
jgi:hypothetical protein